MATNTIYEKLIKEHILTDVTSSGEIMGTYLLERISLKDVKRLRKSSKPAFIYKTTNDEGATEYWFSYVAEDFSLTAKPWCSHSCAKCDLLGTIEGMDCLSYMSCEESLLIEDYDYILEACVTVNTRCNSTRSNSLKLIKCKKFCRTESTTDRKITFKGKIALAQFLDPSIETIADLHAYENKHLMNK